MVLDYGPLWSDLHFLLESQSQDKKLQNKKTLFIIFVKEQKDEGEQASAISCVFTNLLFALKNPEKEQIKITIIFTITTFIFSLCSGVPEEYLLLT